MMLQVEPRIGRGTLHGAPNPGHRAPSFLFINQTRSSRPTRAPCGSFNEGVTNQPTGRQTDQLTDQPTTQPLLEHFRFATISIRHTLLPSPIRKLLRYLSIARG